MIVNSRDDILDGNDPARWNVPVIVNMPDPVAASLGSGDNPAFFGISRNLAASDFGIRSADHSQRFGVAVGFPVEDQHGAAAFRDHHIRDMVDSNLGVSATDHRVGPGDEAFWRNVT